MAQTFWTYSGRIAVDAQGRPILCDECPCPDNTCNRCVPPIPDTVYLTFANLTGSFAPYNGKQIVPWRATCLWGMALSGAWWWSSSDLGNGVSLWWTDISFWWQTEKHYYWEIQIRLPDHGRVMFRDVDWSPCGGEGSCDPASRSWYKIYGGAATVEASYT